ncbi:hypothetical protein IC619_012790 [Hazenella sp. IB182353]|uniref:sigma factor-like helix-turn-helix DNA-binding protein n=1 Tax=Polycladospora coralii TaxID=2771432 RepID=UPI001746DEB3|nr:sigma factor-like helix-turn-helix DNA-binding protein [Polycladospora coralii]MBS7531371.1 hypothetical protein [Polycladospora coralii]
METLRDEYQISLNKVKKLRNQILGKANLKEQDREDLRLLRNMESDLQWTIQRMESSFEPVNRRNIARYAGYQREVSWDSFSKKKQREIEWQEAQKKQPTQAEENAFIQELFDQLSQSEYESFVAVRGEGLSFGQAASLLHCSKSAVQSYVRRAETKLKAYVRSTEVQKDCYSHVPVEQLAIRKPSIYEGANMYFDS